MASAPGGGGRALGGGRGAPVDDIELAPRLPATPAGAFGALDEEDELELIQRRAATHWSYFETSRCGSRQWAGALFGLGAVLFILVLTMIFSPKVNLRPLPKDPALPGAAPGAAGPAAPYRDQSSFHAEFVSMPDPRRCEEHLKYYTGVPHIAGSKEDYDTAVYTRDKLRAYLSPHPGATVDIVEYQVMLCYPDKRSVELLAPTYASLKLEEPALPFDKTSGQEALRKAGSPYATFNAYSGSGDVTADLVYANHGLPEDFDALAAAGVSVEGRLVLVRYGRNFRGLKVMLAEERGAAGVLIYSDPADDGYGRGPVFPEGPWRSNSSVQRGSVQYISVYPGDPLTPGYASTANAPRLARSEAKNLPKIPPLSADDARPLLAALGGAPAASLGARWQGGLPLEYRLGPGPARVRMQVFPRCEERQPIWNVIAKLPGKEEPDRAVILGNHRDAWVFGAADPNSGTASMLELARGFGVLLSAGWRPRRTVVLASWDAEEYALVGSTEWVEDNRAWLEESAVAYLNVDTSTTGPHFFADTTPPLFGVVREAAMTVPDPRLVAECRGDRPAGRGPAPAACALGTSLHAAWLARSRERNETGPNRDTPGYNFLGSGSDFTPFYQHVGVPSFEIGFSGDYGVYHSIYDSFAWMANYGDPGFLYHAACAAVWGSVALRLADAAVLPLDYAEYGRALREQVVERARKAEEAAGGAAGGPSTSRPSAGAPPRWTRSRRRGWRPRGAPAPRGAARAEGGAPAAALRSLNDRLVRAERALLDPAGLERHGVAWYRHLVFAPGLYAGYSSAVFPALAEAMDAGDGPRAAAEQLRLAAAIRRAAGVLLGA
eukprot:tig00000792_g4160.t2